MHSEGISSDFGRSCRYPRKCEHPEALDDGAFVFFTFGCSFLGVGVMVRLVLQILVPAQMNAIDMIDPA